MNELYDLPDIDDLPDLDELDYIADSTTPLMARADDGGVALSFGFDAEWLTALLQRMQADGKIMKGERIDRDTWSRVSEVLRTAVDKGYAQADAPSADEAFRDVLHHSTDVFAAFKVHRMQHDMAAALTDENGDLKPFNQWLNDVQPIASHQVGAWLETEYNTAVIRAHQAADWQQFEAEKDVLPNLKWNPSTSVHPGADHMPFWGTIRPVDDPFWSQHRPGDRWNCKCSLSSTDEPVTALPEGYDTPENDPQPGLKDNPGKTGEIFSPDNNYIREAAPGAKEAVEKLMEEVEKDGVYTTYPTERGKVRVNSLHGKNERAENLEIASYFANKYGEEIDLLPRYDDRKMADTFNRTRNCLQEYKVNGKSQSFNAIDSLLRSASKQANSVVLSISDDISLSVITDALNDRVKRTSITEVIILKGGKDARYTRDEITSDGFIIKQGDFK